MYYAVWQWVSYRVMCQMWLTSQSDYLQNGPIYTKMYLTLKGIVDFLSLTWVFFLMWVLSKCLVNLLSLYMHYMLSYHFGIINIFQIKIIKYLAIMFILLKFVSRLIKHWGKSSLKRAELGHIAVQYKICSMFHYDMYM